jgi:hypothetical protein
VTALLVDSDAQVLRRRRDAPADVGELDDAAVGDERGPDSVPRSLRDAGLPRS